MNKPLTPKQEMFCQEYIVDLNATQAAIRAGYSKKTANEQAARLLAKVSIAARVQELMTTRSKKTEITAETVLKELLRLATVDVTEAFDEMGKLKPLKEIPEDVRRAFSAIEVVELFHGQGDQKLAIGLTSRVKFYDKAKALELLAKHLKLFTDKLEVSGSLTLEDLVTGTKKEP